MKKKTNKPTDVFKYIDMQGGNQDVCWEWKRPLWKGRPYFRVDGRKRCSYVWVLELHTGHEQEEGEVARHKCDNPKCCNPHHLEWGTVQDNSDDMTSRGRHGLSAHAVQHIRNLVAEGRSDQAIADIVGCGRETVRDIRTGRRRKNLDTGTG